MVTDEPHGLLSGSILEDQELLTLRDLCAACSVSANRVLEMVEEGILDPVGSDAAEWRFSAISMRRVRIVRHLQRDLEVNLPGAAVAVQLLEELEQLKALLRRPG